METIAQRKPTMFRLKTDLIERLKVLASKQNRSLNNYVECVLMDVAYNEPNEETIAAMKEAKDGKNLTPVDVSSFESFIKSLEE
jgi:predicted transcriptional regulator